MFKPGLYLNLMKRWQLFNYRPSQLSAWIRQSRGMAFSWITEWTSSHSEVSEVDPAWLSGAGRSVAVPSCKWIWGDAALGDLWMGKQGHPLSTLIYLFLHLLSDVIPETDKDSQRTAAAPPAIVQGPFPVQHKVVFAVFSVGCISMAVPWMCA